MRTRLRRRNRLRFATGLLFAASLSFLAGLADVVLRLSRLGEDLPEVAELDLNPIIAGPERCVAVDARIRLRARETARRPKTW